MNNPAQTVCLVCRVGDAEPGKERLGNVSEPVRSKAMCRAFQYVSAFLKFDRCVVVSHLGEPRSSGKA